MRYPRDSPIGLSFWLSWFLDTNTCKEDHVKHKYKEKKNSRVNWLPGYTNKELQANRDNSIMYLRKHSELSTQKSENLENFY